MSKRLFKEVLRLTPKPSDYQFVDNGSVMAVEKNNKKMFTLNENGNLSLCDNVPLTAELQNVWQSVIESVQQCREYVAEMDRAEDLKAIDFNMPYKKIAEFGGVVLAGMELKDGSGYHFTTWRYLGGTLYHGNYYSNNYEAAKEDFVTRAGLVSENRIFSLKEMTEIYRSISATVESGYEFEDEQIETLKGIRDKIESAVPDLDELPSDLNRHVYEQSL